MSTKIKSKTLQRIKLHYVEYLAGAEKSAYLDKALADLCDDHPALMSLHACAVEMRSQGKPDRSRVRDFFRDFNAWCEQVRVPNNNLGGLRLKRPVLKSRALDAMPADRPLANHRWAQMMRDYCASARIRRELLRRSQDYNGVIC